jgi:hypothetical protein
LVILREVKDLVLHIIAVRRDSAECADEPAIAKLLCSIENEIEEITEAAVEEYSNCF